MDGLVKQLKYAAKIDLAALLGVLMNTKLQTCLTDFPQCLIPVPLHPNRLMKRGFNQSMELARTVSQASGIKVDPWCVKRVLDTPPQASLPATARRNNVRAAFCLSRPLNYTHVAIIDDVITSAWTAHELAKLLIDAGVERIDVWVCCRAFPQRS
ncbi:MAG: ComF family protein [Gammaproteobacteria bacterium]